MTHPRIYFVCPDDDEPSGGIRGIYAAADHLNDAGVPATIVHERPGFRCTWFSSPTRVMCADDANAGRAAAAAVRTRYTPEAERDSVVRVFTGLLERVSRGALAKPAISA